MELICFEISPNKIIIDANPLKAVHVYYSPLLNKFNIDMLRMPIGNINNKKITFFNKSRYITKRINNIRLWVDFFFKRLYNINYRKCGRQCITESYTEWYRTIACVICFAYPGILNLYNYNDTL